MRWRLEVEEQTGSCSGEGNANTGLEERVGSVTMSSVIPAVVKQPPTVKGGIMHLHGNRGLHSLVVKCFEGTTLGVW